MAAFGWPVRLSRHTGLSPCVYDLRRIRIYRNQPNQPWLLVWDLAPPPNSKPPLVDDWDGDGWLDIVYVYNRMDDTKAISVWRGAPNFEFVPIESDYSGYIWPYIVDWNDYDNDGDLDSAFSGEVSFSRTLTLVLNEEAGGTVQPVAGEGGFAVTSADLDNDGRLDLLSTEGSEGDLGSVFRLHTNLGGAPWFEFTDLPFRGAGFSTISCADYDQDGDADVLVSGFTNWTPSLRLLRNVITVSNPPPSIPAEPQSVVGPGGSVHLRWTGSSDANQSGGLTYNVRAGLSPESVEIIAPNADLDTGRLLVPRRGNAGSRTASFLTNLLAGTYHWSVQAVDNAFAASAFAPSAAFTIPPGAPRDLECVATDIRYQHATLTGSVIPNGADTLVWFEYGFDESFGTTTDPVAAGSGVSAISVTNEIAGLQTAVTYYFRCTASNAVDVTHSLTHSLHILNTAPTINLSQNWIVSTAVNVAAAPIEFIIGDLETLPENLRVSAIAAPAHDSNTHLLSPEGIVLAGEGSNRTLTLSPVPDERGSIRIALSVADEQGSVTSVYVILKVHDFTRVQAVPQGLGTSLAWVDVDHDGWPDLLGNLKWIQNLAGTNLVARSLTQGTTVTGAMQPFDAEGDGWIDFAMTGTHISEFLTQVFTNRQTVDHLPTAFRALPSILQPGFGAGTLSAVDYDHDGDADLVAFGSTNLTPISAFGTQVWRNDGNLVFTPVAGVFPRLSLGDMVWADFDADGDTDVIVMGSTNRAASGPYTALLLNNGSGEFSTSDVVLPQLSSGFVTAGDIDNDNDFDLVSAGVYMLNNRPTGMGVVLRHNPDHSFEEVLRLPDFIEPRGILVDADNDGDLDLFYAGQRDMFPTMYLHFYLNQGGGEFVRVAEPEGLSPWPLAFGDFDHDSDLDVATPTLLYRNLTRNINAPPSAPTELGSEISGAHVTLRWLRADDPNQAGGLTYNLRVGSAPGGMDIMSPMADPVTGMRYVTGPGNASQSTV